MRDFKSFEKVFRQSMQDFFDIQVKENLKREIRFLYKEYEMNAIEEAEKEQEKRQRGVHINKVFTKIGDRNEF